MKNIFWSVLLLALGLGLAGCSKGTETAPSPKVNGVTVDVPKLQAAFATASQDLQSQVAQVSYGVRYADYVKSLDALDKLSNAPGLTDAQKKVVNDLIEQVKQVMSAAPPKQ